MTALLECVVTVDKETKDLIHPDHDKLLEQYQAWRIGTDHGIIVDYDLRKYCKSAMDFLQADGAAKISRSGSTTTYGGTGLLLEMLNKCEPLGINTSSRHSKIDAATRNMMANLYETTPGR